MRCLTHGSRGGQQQLTQQQQRRGSGLVQHSLSYLPLGGRATPTRRSAPLLPRTSLLPCRASEGSQQPSSEQPAPYSSGNGHVQILPTTRPEAGDPSSHACLPGNEQGSVHAEPPTSPTPIAATAQPSTSQQQQQQQQREVAASKATPSHAPARLPSLPGAQIQAVPPSTAQLTPLDPTSTSSSSKPYMLLLPDLDGVGMTSRRSWPDLSRAFELQVLTLSPDFALPSSSSSSTPTPTFTDLVSLVTAHIGSYLAAAPPERPVYLCGEGFGGVLALAAILHLPKQVHRLLLINPSTSYLESPLHRLQPLLARGSPPGLQLGLPLALAPALVAASDPLVAASEILGIPMAGGNGSGSGSSKQGRDSRRSAFQSAVSLGLGLMRKNPADVAGEAVRLAASTLEQVRQISSTLSPEAVSRRLSLLEEGITLVTPRLRDVEQRAMVLVGGRDPVLPSEEAGTKLAQELQRAFVKVLPESGHCPLSEPGVNIVELLQQEGFYTQRRVFTSDVGPAGRKIQGSGFGRAGPLEIPSLKEIERAGSEWTDTLRNYCSPVFFSTLEDGTVVEGLEGLPVDERPLLVVGNHQLYAFDMNVMVQEVVQERGLLLRGLAHPSLFTSVGSGVDGKEAGTGSSRESAKEGSGNGKSGSKSDGKSGSKSDGKGDGKGDGAAGSNDMLTPRAMANTYRTFGAVEVSGKNFFKLLQSKEAVLLYPGGVREGFKRKRENYQLFWPSKPEFVRMAARFNTTVIPLAAVGLEDSIQLVLDSDELLNNPLLGQRSRELAEATRAARAGVNVDPDNDQSFVPPIIAPAVPQRLYFLFGRPVRLTPDLYDDREAAERVYAQIKAQLERDIGYLLRKREQDPYKDFFARYLYENPPLAGPGAKRKAPTFKP